MAEVQSVAYGRDGTEALSDAIRAAQDGDPLAPVTIVVPSNLAGLSARRTLAEQGGIANVAFDTPFGLAERLGRARGGRRAHADHRAGARGRDPGGAARRAGILRSRGGALRHRVGVGPPVRRAVASSAGHTGPHPSGRHAACAGPGGALRPRAGPTRELRRRGHARRTCARRRAGWRAGGCSPGRGDRPPPATAPAGAARSRRRGDRGPSHRVDRRPDG